MKNFFIMAALLVAALTATLFFEEETAPFTPTRDPQASVVLPRANGAAELEDLSRRSEAIVEDFRERHPLPAENSKSPQIEAIEESVKEEMELYESTMASVQTVLEDLSKAKAALDRAIQEGESREKIQELNQAFEEKAQILQTEQAKLQQSYLEAMSAYDSAIAQNIN